MKAAAPEVVGWHEAVAPGQLPGDILILLRFAWQLELTLQGRFAYSSLAQVTTRLEVNGFRTSVTPCAWCALND